MKKNEGKVRTKEDNFLRWEKINSSGTEQRARVPGGWIVKSKSDRVAMVFVPDPKHAWKGLLT